jgi:hypothetical protein
MSLSKFTLVFGTSIDVVQTEIIAKGMYIGSRAEDIINKLTLTILPSSIPINLVVKSVSELGFKDRANLEQICYMASEIGLVKCPAEIGPLLRLHYPEQPNGEWLVVAMDSVTDSKGEPRMFLVGHNNGGRWLVADHADPQHTYGNTKKFVFVIP